MPATEEDRQRVADVFTIGPRWIYRMVVFIGAGAAVGGLFGTALTAFLGMGFGSLLGFTAMMVLFVAEDRDEVVAIARRLIEEQFAAPTGDPQPGRPAGTG